MHPVDLTPSGSQVVQEGVIAQQDSGFFGTLGGILTGGVRTLIDLELAERIRTQDTAEVARQENPPPPPPGQGSSFSRFTPIELGGLAVAGALSIALLTGQFRPSS